MYLEDELKEFKSPSEILKERHLGQDWLVHKNQQIKIENKFGEIYVTLRGIALSNGVKGDRILVRNISSNKLLKDLLKSEKKYQFFVNFINFMSYNMSGEKKMVGSIKNFTGQRVEVSQTMAESKARTKQINTSNPNCFKFKVDAVLTSESREALKVMAENPSINMEAVDRIKQKIKDGEYPIDFDKLADKLLESYWVSKS